MLDQKASNSEPNKLYGFYLRDETEGPSQRSDCSYHDL